MSEKTDLLRLEGVSKEYWENEQGRSAKILDNIEIAINQGESVSIAGPSGSGKSTLLNLMGALDYPTTGRVLFNGHDLASMREKALARIRNQEVGFVFQLHHLLPQCSVIENVLLPTLPFGARPDAEKRATALLERVGLQDRLYHRPGQLSGGERQRVAVVRALINAPTMLLADEPTGSLDRSAAESLTNLLTELNASEDIALVVVTHTMELANRMQRCYELRDGTLQERVD